MERVWVLSLLTLLVLVAAVRCEKEDCPDLERQKRQTAAAAPVALAAGGAPAGGRPSGGSPAGWGGPPSHGGGGWWGGGWDDDEWSWGQGGYYKDKCKPPKNCPRCWWLPNDLAIIPKTCLAFCIKKKECFCQF